MLPGGKIILSAGSRHSALLDTEGTVWMLGSNDVGQLGLAHKHKVSEISKVGGEWKSVCCVDKGTLFLSENGEIYACGDTTYILPLHVRKDGFIRPVNKELPPFHSISAREEFCMMLDEEGNVWNFGENNCGQLGRVSVNTQRGNVGNHDSIGQLHGLPRIKMISSGLSYSLLLDEDGFVWGFGDNSSYQLGLTSNSNCIKFPMKIEGLSSIQKISAGSRHSLYIDEFGDLWGTGKSFGLPCECKTPTNLSQLYSELPPIVDIAVGYGVSFLRSASGFVWGIGCNLEGQLGIGDKMKTKFIQLSSLPPIQMISTFAGHALFIDEDGYVWGCGNNQNGQLDPSGNSEKYISIPQKLSDSIKLSVFDISRKKSAKRPQ